MNIKNVKIRTILLIGFSAVGVMVIGLGWLAFSQSRSIWQNTSDLYNHPFQVNIAVREIKSNITAMHRSLKDVILSENELEMTKYLNRIAADESAVYKGFELVYANYLGSKSTVDSAYAAFRNWQGIRDTTIQLCRQGRKAEAAFRTTHGAEVFNNDLVGRIQKLEDFAMSKASEFYSSAEYSKNKLQKQLWMVIGLIFSLTIIIAYFILQAVTHPLRILTLATHEQAQGNFASRSSYESGNEMGQLSSSFNKMADSIESEIIIKTGITKISDSMLGMDDIRHFGNSLLSALLNHTHSDMGAIYFLSEGSGVFEPGFSVGLSHEKLRSFSGDHYEGEFGRTFLDKKITHIRNIPEDSVFDFATVTGTFKPKEILNIPILIQDRVVAVISLASIYQYSNQVLEMLRIAEKNLAAGISSMMSFQKIKDYTLKLDQQNTELEMQSRELKLQAAEMHEQNAELEMQKRQIDDANRLKSEFLSSMSHELRTPLNAVIALSGVLSRKLKSKIPEDEFSYLEIIERNGKNLLNLINEILDLSRIEAGKADVQISAFSMREAVGSILDSLQVQIQEKNLEVVNQISADFPLILTDRTKCHHIIQNLISNAVKFTDHGSITISSGLIGSEVFVSVTDTGIGIAADQLPHIFDQFHQVDGTSSRKHEGTGLGLAIAEKYSQLLNGRLEVTSEPGKGSRFTLVLPLLNAANHLVDENIIHDSGTGHYSTFERPGKESPERKTVLIIEDSEPAIIQLSEILTGQNYAFLVARNGFEALEIVETTIPDAIILDLMMPGMDGFEVLEKIRGTAATAHIPVLILTAKYLNKSELNRLTSNNIHQLVQKGDVGKEELLKAISGMIAAKRPLVKQLPKHAKPVTGKDSVTILLVEDNADNVKTIEVLLDSRHQLVIARDGMEGIEKAGSVSPDLILLAISLPLKDGFSVLEEIRKMESLNEVPVIAVTARAMKGDREHFLMYGFDDYISKPLSSEVFEDTLGKWILQ